MVIKLNIRQTEMTQDILDLIDNGRPSAYAIIEGIDDISGTASFYEYDQGLLLLYEIKNLPVARGCRGGVFGLHIHEGGSCSGYYNEPFAGTGTHLNTDNCMHPYHLGDLPSVYGKNGTAWALIYLDKLNTEDIINRTLVLHQRPDDYSNQASGNSGNKIACGKIQRYLIQPR